ncbi:cytochrome c [Phaeobacter sp. HF9A]|uniref:c-type cytochrome n=1 Tax=Phaeobacter sp. HF9A TaxID=2721561 RepID=UPI001430388B|nr:cytochrome c [Phaeobacter sp. HF9A]NIZ13123.1 cytochrome c [Phaeobacter sp. HF9A]
MSRRCPTSPVLILGLFFALLTAVPATIAEGEIRNRHVKYRIALMNSQKNAVIELTNMTSGRLPFDRARARALRKALMQTTAAIPKAFRRKRMEPDSHARPEVWTHQEDFTLRAEAAETAAKALNTRNLAGLRRSLPDLIQTCHSCHQTFRAHVNEFTTH